MAFRVEIVPRAFDDLDSIATYIKTQSSFRVAERWFNGILRAISLLAEMPERCPVAEESADLGAEVRVLLFGRGNQQYKVYFVVHQPSAAEGIVRVIHVRHWARRSPNVDELDDLMDDTTDESDYES